MNVAGGIGDLACNNDAGFLSSFAGAPALWIGQNSGL